MEYFHLEKDISFDLNEQRNMASGMLGISDPNMLGDWNFTLLEQNLGLASAEISLPIFAGGKINAANKAAEIKYELSENQHRIKGGNIKSKESRESSETKRGGIGDKNNWS